MEKEDGEKEKGKKKGKMDSFLLELQKKKNSGGNLKYNHDESQPNTQIQRQMKVQRMKEV